MGVRTPSGAPALVATLPPRRLPKSVHFSMATSVHLSVAIDMDPREGGNEVRRHGSIDGPGQTEPEVVEPVPGLEPAAVRRAEVVRFDEPGAAAQHT